MKIRNLRKPPTYDLPRERPPAPRFQKASSFDSSIAGGEEVVLLPCSARAEAHTPAMADVLAGVSAAHFSFSSSPGRCELS